MPGEPIVEVVIQLRADVDEDRLDDLTRRLLTDIREVEVESAERASDGPAPVGARGVDLVAIGGLLIKLAPSVLPAVLDRLRAWLLRGADRAVKLKIQDGTRSVEMEFTPGSMSPDEMVALVEKVKATFA